MSPANGPVPAEYTATDLADLYLARNGEVVEVLSEGKWHRVAWSDRAYDGSPYGSTGFASEGEGLLFPEDIIESWRVTT